MDKFRQPKIEPTIDFNDDVAPHLPPLLVRFVKRTFIGRLPNTAREVTAGIDDVADLSEAARAGALSSSAEETARVLLGAGKAVLVDESDMARLAPPRLRRGMLTTGATDGPPTPRGE